mmetsp:Transcript_29250/g.85771  ORF Transcript_29250/g.85771 Transcript_29250/m.85771 type:complete len:85 (-) Transcript_29250:1593-1847(-)
MLDMTKVYAVMGGLLGAAAVSQVPGGIVVSALHKGAYAIGVGLTLGMSKWSWTAEIWNSYIVDNLEKVFDALHSGFVNGLRSDA